MGDYVHKPIVVYGTRERVEKAISVLREIITKYAPTTVAAVNDNLALQPPPLMANEFVYFLIPGSGGKDGGAIDRRWQNYIWHWKREVFEEDRWLQWVELELGEVEKDSIKQTQMDFREEFYEEQDP